MGGVGGGVRLGGWGEGRANGTGKRGANGTERGEAGVGVGGVVPVLGFQFLVTLF